ncbi:MAG: hypothetical protein KDJ43_02155, partial [Rhizobiaceae bacterium]|nr:hypothetical protein [Rhizobiaceae bacterium]
IWPRFSKRSTIQCVGADIPVAFQIGITAAQANPFRHVVSKRHSIGRFQRRDAGVSDRRPGLARRPLMGLPVAKLPV